MRRIALLVVGLALLGCSTKYIKFPASEYLTAYWADRLTLQDETFAARKRCQAVKAAILAPGTGVPMVTPVPAKVEELRVKCEQLEARLEQLGKRDQATIEASLKGDTIDKESVENLRSITGPLLQLVFDIAKGAL